MGRVMWDRHPEKDAALAAAVADPEMRDWRQVAEVVGESLDACRLRAARKRYPGWDFPRTGYGRPSHAIPLISSPAPPRLTGAELWHQVEATTDRDVARHRAERLVDIEIPDDRPVGISFISDQHLRQSGPIMVRPMREDAELVRDTDGLYAVLGGDGVDNHIKHREAMANGGDKPSASWRLYDHYLGMFVTPRGDSKLLAVVSGNHDDWTRDFTGVDQVAALAERNRVHYCPDEALLRVALNGQRYQLLMRHQYLYNSRFNLGHAVKRLWEMGNDDFDVGVIGHHHEPACEPFMKHGVQRYALRPGSYQFTSTYSRRKGFPHAMPTCPTVILWPNRRSVFGVWDVWQAAGYLRWLRDQWPESDVARPAA